MNPAISTQTNNEQLQTLTAQIKHLNDCILTLAIVIDNKNSETTASVNAEYSINTLSTYLSAIKSSAQLNNLS